MSAEEVLRLVRDGWNLSWGVGFAHVDKSPGEHFDSAIEYARMEAGDIEDAAPGDTEALTDRDWVDAYARVSSAVLGATTISGKDATRILEATQKALEILRALASHTGEDE